MSRVKRAARHLKRFLLLYSILALIVGLAAGYAFHEFFAAHKALVRDLVVLFAILTIYPSMIQLKIGKMGEALRRVKPLTVGVLMIFVVTPLIALGLATLLPRKIALGYVLLSTVPSSSASIGYVLICGGNLELALALRLLSIPGAFVSVPGYTSIYAAMASVPVPLATILESLAITILVPLAAGQLTRYLLIHRRVKAALACPGGDERFPCTRLPGELRIRDVSEAHGLLKRIEACIVGRLEEATKPHLSLMTMVSMLILMALVIASKAMLMVEHPLLALKIIGVEETGLVAALLLVTLIDLALRIPFEDHAAVAFLSPTKNVGIAAAVAMTAFGAETVLPIALFPVIQAPTMIAYLQAVPVVKRLFEKISVRRTEARVVER